MSQPEPSEHRHDAEAAIDAQGARVTRTITVRAPIEVGWECLTDPASLAEWFGDSATFPDGTGAGATGSFGWSDEGEFPARIERAQRPHVWAFRWGRRGEPLRDDSSTLATFALERVDGGTRVTVVETGFERLGDEVAVRAALADNREGWTSELDELIALIARRWLEAAR